MRPRPTVWLPCLLVLALAGSAVPRAGAAVGAVVAVPGSQSAGYATPVALTLDRTLTFMNQDRIGQPHNVVARTATRDGGRPWCVGPYAGPACPLFWSAVISGGDATAVLGLEDAPPGRYDFYCQPHPTMTGTLIVT